MRRLIGVRVASAVALVATLTFILIAAVVVAPRAVAQVQGPSVLTSLGGSLRRAALAGLRQQRGVLVFTRTAGYRHDSIPAGIECFRRLAAEWERPFLATEDPAQFTPEVLDDYGVVVFLNTTGDVLDEPQQVAFEAFVRDGGNFLGVHAAADTEYDWAFYGDCVGARFLSHPRVQPASIDVLDRAHPSTWHLPARFVRRDEWYDFRAAPSPAFQPLLQLDETSFEGEGMVVAGRSETHPIAWCRTLGSARCLYTGGGHTSEAFEEPGFVQHLRGALYWLLDRD